MNTFLALLIILTTSIYGTYSNILNQITSINKNQVSDQSLVMQFLKNVESTKSTSVCQILLKSSVQNKINHFQSIVSACPENNFCKIAMGNNGIAYGAQNSKLQSK